MKYIKAHLFLIICGAVVLVALTVYFWPLSSMKADLTTEADAFAALIDQPQNLINVKLSPTPKDQNLPGPAIPSFTKAKQTVMDNILAQKTKVESMVANLNRAGKVDAEGNPLLDGLPLPGLLPSFSSAKWGDIGGYKIYRYMPTFGHWTYQLVTGRKNTLPNYDSYLFAAVPPGQKEVDDAWTERVALLNRENTRRDARGNTVARPDPRATSPEAKSTFMRDYVSRRANQYTMYATRDLFQIRSFEPSANSMEIQIFESMIDLWVQQDLVNTIAALNANSSSVATSVIKRAERIEVGSTAGATDYVSNANPTATGTLEHHGSTGAADIFLTNMAAGGVGGGGGGGAAPGALDYSKGMTGKTSSDKYDVTHFSIIIYVEPSKLNSFISELYKQNNGYTILKVSFDTVDPVEAASNGYLYGKVPVIRAVILGEVSFAREWTKALMPKEFRKTLGIPDDPAKNGAR